jgi:hypothetical protein
LQILCTNNNVVSTNKCKVGKMQNEILAAEGCIANTLGLRLAGLTCHVTMHALLWREVSVLNVI